MQCYISPQTLKKQTKVLTKSWSSPISSIEARKILTALYGYRNPHHYSKYAKSNDGSRQAISQEFLLHNLDFFVQRLSVLGSISQDQALVHLQQLWKAYIPRSGFFPNYCSFTFHGELQDFLMKRDVEAIPYGFHGSPAVKDAIEALGIPHPEVGLVEVNGAVADFTYRLGPNDVVVVYPFASSNKRITRSLTPEGRPVFVLDVHLGGLAKYLRMAGFDTLYEPQDLGDEVLATLSASENRVVLTRDIGLLKRSTVIWGYWVRSTESKSQFREIVERYTLTPHFDPFTRCTECNGEIHAVDIALVQSRDDVPENITNEYSEFKECRGCHKIYWKGSHYDRMKSFLSQF